jgi:hypothetical protein
MPTGASTPIYLDWTFWSFVAAALAIILSQLPPIKLWLRPKRLEVEVNSRVFIQHAVGNPNMALVVTLRNTGGRVLRIKGLAIHLSRDGTSVGTYPAQNYFETGASTTPVLFVPFALGPGADWSKSVTFLNWSDRNTEKEFRERRATLKADIQQKIAERNPNVPPELVEADAPNLTPFLALFDRQFVWQRGEYVLTLTVDAEPGSASFRRQYRFTLYDSDTADLRAHVEGYKYGDGILWPCDKHEGLNVPLAEHVSTP